MEEKKSYDTRKILREMQDEYWRGIEGAEGAVAAETADYVVFRLAGERFGIPSGIAKEILKVPKLVRIPRVGEHIRGIFNLRGEVVAVTDLRPLFGLSGSEVPRRGRLVVVEAAGLLTALLTDAVEGIRTIEDAAVEPLTEGLPGFPRLAVSGQVAEEEGMLMLLDLEHILSRPEFVVDQKGESEG